MDEMEEEAMQESWVYYYTTTTGRGMTHITARSTAASVKLAIAQSRPGVSVEHLRCIGYA
jgi:hypothetical protein